MFDWRSLGSLLALIPRRRLMAVLVAVCAASALEAVGLLLLLPLLQAVGIDTGDGFLDGAIASFGRGLASLGAQPTVGTLLIAYVLVAGLQAAIQWWQGLLNTRLAQDVVTDLRRSTYKAISQADWVFLSRNRVSEFTHILTEETDRVGIAASMTVDLVVSVCVALVYFGLALWMAPAVTTVVVVLGLVIAAAMRMQFARARRSGEDASNASGDLYNAVLEHLASLKTALSFGAEDRHGREFGKRADTLRSVRVRLADEYGRFTQLLVLGSTCGLAVIVYVSVRLLNVQAGELLLVLFVFARLMPRVTSLYERAQGIVTQLPAFATILDTQNRCLAATRPARVAADDSVTLRDEIRFESVHFSYSTDASPALSGVDLTIAAGATTAIVGPSGAGKSTIADLLLGLLSPTQGHVLIDGDVLGPSNHESWRQQIGYVPQETFLFHDSIRGNLAWAKPGATDDEIWKALALASADEFVRALPQRLDTIVGDRGVLVSGGERQRISMARALLRRPRLLILDEATSSLDGENEFRIQRAIDNLHRQVTIVAITHRLSSIRRADLIHVVEQGRVVESGTWSDLVSRPLGRFNAMWRVQESQGIQFLRSNEVLAAAGAHSR